MLIVYPDKDMEHSLSGEEVPFFPLHYPAHRPPAFHRRPLSIPLQLMPEGAGLDFNTMSLLCKSTYSVQYKELEDRP